MHFKKKFSVFLLAAGTAIFVLAIACFHIPESKPPVAQVSAMSDAVAKTPGVHLPVSLLITSLVMIGLGGYLARPASNPIAKGLTLDFSERGPKSRKTLS